jgi:hypothetical protein
VGRAARVCCLFLGALAACSSSDPEVDRLLALLKNGSPAGTKLATLGPDHADGIPAILELMAEDNRRFVQTTCLEALLSMEAGSDAEPAIARAMKSGDPAVVSTASLVMWKVGSNKTFALAELVERAQVDPSVLPLLRRTPPLPADVASDYSQVLPLRILAALGESMRAALPRIEESLDAPTADERIAAANALYRVSGKLQPALDRLAHEFRTENYFLRQRIHIVWVDMLQAQPEAMKIELEKLAKSDHEAVAQMAGSMTRD